MAGADLHTHSTFSDGNRSPLDLLRIAVAQQVKVLAITDHNTADGYREGAPLAEETGVRLIPGIEIVCSGEGMENPPPGCDVDILGYFMDVEAPAFHACEKACQQDHRMRIGRRCEKLCQLGYGVTPEELQAINPRYSSTASIARILIEKGFAEDYVAAYQIISRSNDAVPPAALSIKDCISMLHHAGGVAVLAHPCPQYVRYQGKRLDTEGIRYLASLGLDGIEIAHPKLTPMDKCHFRQLAQRFHLLPGGGSDEHSFIGTCITLGTQEVEPAWVDALEAKARIYREGCKKTV